MTKNALLFIMASIASGFTKMFQGDQKITKGISGKYKRINAPQYEQMMINRKKKRRIKNKMAKESRRINRYKRART